MAAAPGMKSRRRAGSASRVSYLFFLIFAILAAGILATAFFSYQAYKKRLLIEMEHQLSAIANLKASETGPMAQRALRGCGFRLWQYGFLRLAQRYFINPQDKDAEQQIGNWLNLFPKHYEYDQAHLLDPQGAIRMSFPPGSRLTLPLCCSALRKLCSRGG